MQNYKTLSNDEARKITESQSEADKGFQILKEYLTSKELGFNYDRNIGFVGVNPEKPDASYTMVVSPTFKNFVFEETPSHAAASIVSFYSGGKASHTAAIATINHEPLQISEITLLEVGKDGNVVETTVDRKVLESQSAEEIAKRMGTSHLEGDSAIVADTSVASEDQRLMTGYVMETLLNDNYAAPLYPAEGVQTLMQDSGISKKFNQAVELRANLFDLGFEITICTSTSSNACTSTSSSFTIFSAS